MRALRFALRRFDEEPVAVLATSRLPAETDDRPPLADVLPPGRFETLPVAPLDPSAIREVLTAVTATVSRPTLLRIYEVSGGNPLYALELARGLTTGGAGAGPGSALPLPGSLKGAIDRRLDGAPPGIAPVLEVVAALGTTTVRELGRTLEGTDVEELLISAQQSELLVVEDDLRIRFAHPLVGPGVYGRMDPISRRALHARLAEHAEDPDARARHLALSTEEENADLAALLEAAAERAARRGASDLAAAFARHGRRLTPAHDQESARRRALAEIEYAAAAGEIGRALALADELVASSPPGPARAEALLVRADIEDDDIATAIGFLEEAARESEDDERLHGRVLLHLAETAILLDGRMEELIARGRDALAIAERMDDPDLRALALQDLAYYEALAGGPPPTPAEASEHGAPRNLTQTHSPESLMARRFLWAGDLATAREMLERDLARVIRTGNEHQRLYRLADLALVELAAGNLRPAEDLARDGMQAARDAESTYAERRMLYVVSLVETWLGRIDAARRAASSIVEVELEKRDRAGIVRGRIAMGLLLLTAGDPGAAAAELSQAAQLLDEMGIEQPASFPALPDAIEALSLSGDVDAAETLLERLDRQARTSESSWAMAAVRASRGHLLHATGDPEGARAELQAAADAFDLLGFRPDAARAVLAGAHALLRAGKRTSASAAFVDARERFAAMGASLWEARAAEGLERSSPGRASGALTETERRVATLVAEGNRNKEIAQTLFMGVATVEAHLTRIYRKLGIRGRSELASLVASGTVEVPPSGEPDRAEA